MAYQLFKVNLPKTRDQSPIHFGLALSLPKGEVWRGGQNTKTNTEGAGVYAELAEALWFCFWRALVRCFFWRDGAVVLWRWNRRQNTEGAGVLVSVFFGRH